MDGAYVSQAKEVEEHPHLDPTLLETIMRTKIIAFIAGALFAASTMPSTAAESHKARKAGYATSAYSETFRRSNAYVAPRDVEAPRLSGSQLNGAMSAPAGR